MPTGFIYVVTTVRSDYSLPAGCVPTECNGRLYLGPCKRRMRPRVNVGDFVFGISPAGTTPRRVVFAAEVAACMTFEAAHAMFPDLRGTAVHVEPVPGAGDFPRSRYRHIHGSMHADCWESDLVNGRDRFFAFRPPDGCLNQWLGAGGPEVDGDVMSLLKECRVHGSADLGPNTGTPDSPVAHGNLYTGLHLETPAPDRLVALVRARAVVPAAGTGLTKPRRGGAGCDEPADCERKGPC